MQWIYFDVDIMCMLRVAASTAYRFGYNRIYGCVKDVVKNIDAVKRSASAGAP